MAWNKSSFFPLFFRLTSLEGISDTMKGAGGCLYGLMNVRGVVKNNLKWIMVTSDHNNESWSYENRKQLCMQEGVYS